VVNKVEKLNGPNSVHPNPAVLATVVKKAVKLGRQDAVYETENKHDSIMRHGHRRTGC